MADNDTIKAGNLPLHNRHVSVTFSCPVYVRDYLFRRAKDEDIKYSSLVRRALLKEYAVDLDEALRREHSEGSCVAFRKGSSD